MDKDSTVYKQLSRKTKTELVHTAIEYCIENPESMTREQLIQALIDRNVREEVMFCARKFLELEETCFGFFNSGKDVVLNRSRLKRAEAMIQDCIKDVFKVLFEEI